MSQIIASIIGSIGFSIVFGIRRAYMLPIAVNAGLSWAVYLLVNGFAGDFAANMVSAMFCSLVAALMARRLRVPTVVLQMPATVPMVPGGSLYYTIYYVFAGDMPTAKELLFLHRTRRFRHGDRLCGRERAVQDDRRKESRTLTRDFQ